MNLNGQNDQFLENFKDRISAFSFENNKIRPYKILEQNSLYWSKIFSEIFSFYWNFWQIFDKYGEFWIEIIQFTFNFWYKMDNFDWKKCYQVGSIYGFWQVWLRKSAFYVSNKIQKLYRSLTIHKIWWNRKYKSRHYLAVFSQPFLCTKILKNSKFWKNFKKVLKASYTLKYPKYWLFYP